MPTALHHSDPNDTASRLDAVLPSDAEGHVLFLENLSAADAAAVCDALATRRGLRFHHLHADTLVQERFEETQGSLREAFDEARGGSVLLFTGVEALLEAKLPTGAGEPSAPDAGRRLRRYLLDRADAFNGIVALSQCGPEPSTDEGVDAEGTPERRDHAVVITA